MTVIRSGGVREGWGAQKSRMITWHDPAPTAAIGAAMDGLEYVRATIDGQLPSPPITQLMQFEPVSVEPGKAVFTCMPDESALQRRRRRLWQFCLHTAGQPRWVVRYTARCRRATVSPRSRSRSTS